MAFDCSKQSPKGSFAATLNKGKGPAVTPHFKRPEKVTIHEGVVVVLTTLVVMVAKVTSAIKVFGNVLRRSTQSLKALDLISLTNLESVKH